MGGQENEKKDNTGNSPQEWLEVQPEEGVTYDAPVELSDLKHFLHLLRTTKNIYGEYLLPLHPLYSTCVATECRGITQWEKELTLTSISPTPTQEEPSLNTEIKGEVKYGFVSPASPAFFDYDTLKDLRETALARFVQALRIIADALHADDETLNKRNEEQYESDDFLFLKFYKNPTKKNETEHQPCDDCIFLDMRDTAYGIIAPFVDAAQWLGTVPEPPPLPGEMSEEERVSLAESFISYDDMSDLQLRIVGFTSPEQVSEAFKHHERLYTHAPISALRVGLSPWVKSMNIIYPDVFPARVRIDGQGVPLFWGNNNTNSIPPFHFTVQENGTSSAKLNFTLDCGCDTTLELSGHNVCTYETSTQTTEPGEYEARVVGTVFTENWELLTPLEGEDIAQHFTSTREGRIDLVGEVEETALLVNRYTRELFWKIDVRIPLVCDNVLHLKLPKDKYRPVWTTDFVNLTVCLQDNGTMQPQQGAILKCVGELFLEGEKLTDDE